MFNGWSNQGIVEYNCICEYVKNDRIHGKAFEEEFRQTQLQKIVDKKRDHFESQQGQKKLCIIPTAYNDLEDFDFDVNTEPEVLTDLSTSQSTGISSTHFSTPTQPPFTSPTQQFTGLPTQPIFTFDMDNVGMTNQTSV